MICAENLTLKFDDFTALKNMNCQIPDGRIYGLVGSNGAGKSTFLRLATGIYRPTEGRVTVDGKPVYENPEVKKRIVYVPDELYFLPQSNMKEMASLYAAIYESFDYERFEKNKRLNSFSKGMKRQVSTILARSAMPEILLFDETFDGLDPVMRNLVKQVIDSDVRERNTTTIITSHSLRELEDTCDQLALLHKGGIVFESDIDNLKTALFKIQIAFDHPFGKQDIEGVEMLNYSQVGSVATFIVRGDREQTAARLREMNPLLLDVLPLNLEEVFIYEMEALGYAFKDVIM